MKAIEQYFPVVLFILQHKVVLAFVFVDEIPKNVAIFESQTLWMKSQSVAIKKATEQGRVAQKPVNANPRLKVNRRLCFSS